MRLCARGAQPRLVEGVMVRFEAWAHFSGFFSGREEVAWRSVPRKVSSVSGEVLTTPLLSNGVSFPRSSGAGWTLHSRVEVPYVPIPQWQAQEPGTFCSNTR